MAALTNRISIRDVVAGVSVALVVIPQSMAYAEIAGLPPVTGLYAAALPAIAAAPFASSRYLQTGPVAMTALLTFGALSTIATPGTAEYVELAVLLALVVGVTRLTLGLLRAGAITNYMSPPVILGFTTAAAILIGASQIGSALGVEDTPDDLRLRLIEVATSPGSWDLGAVLITVGVGVLVLGGRRLHPLFPGVLVAVVVGILIGATTGYDAPLIGAVPEGLPPFSLSFPWGRLPDLVVPGVVIATVGFAEATAISRTFALQDRERWDASRELVGQGAANLGAALTGGFPVGGSFSRSSIDRLAGSRTRWSGAVTGVVVLAFMPFAGVLADLPRAVLGAIVIFATYQLIRVDEIVRLVKVSRGQAGIAAFTAAMTLALSPRVDVAVLLGILAAGGLHLHRESSRLRVPVRRHNGCLTLQPHGVLYYGSAGYLYAALTDELADRGDATSVQLDLDRLGRIDHTGFQTLKSFAEVVRAADLEFEVINIPAHASGLFTRSGGL